MRVYETERCHRQFRRGERSDVERTDGPVGRPTGAVGEGWVRPVDGESGFGDRHGRRAPGVGA